MTHTIKNNLKTTSPNKTIKNTIILNKIARNNDDFTLLCLAKKNCDIHRKIPITIKRLATILTSLIYLLILEDKKILLLIQLTCTLSL